MGEQYRVSICGENVFLNIDGDIARYGFFVNVFVCSENRELASVRAKKLVRDSLLRGHKVEGDFLDIIELMVDEIVVLPAGFECGVQGFAWYKDDVKTC